MPSTITFDDWPKPSEILDYFRRMEHVITGYRTQLDAHVPQNSPFFGMTIDELNNAFANLRQELEDEVVMLLAASFEAMFQVDLRNRVQSKGPKTPITRRLRKLWMSQKKKTYIPAEFILDVWKDVYPLHRNLIGQLNQLYQFRHWLAHGRYWHQKSGLTDVTPMEAWNVGRELFDRLPGIPPIN